MPRRRDYKRKSGTAATTSRDFLSNKPVNDWKRSSCNTADWGSATPLVTTRLGSEGEWGQPIEAWSTTLRDAGVDVAGASGSRRPGHRAGLWTPAPRVQWTCKDWASVPALTQEIRSSLTPRTPARRVNYVTSSCQAFSHQQPHEFVGKDNRAMPN